MLNDVHGLWVVPAVSSPLQNHIYIAYFDDVATFHTTPYITTVYATSQTEPTPSIFDATSQTSLDFDEIEPLASVFNSTTQNTPEFDEFKAMKLPATTTFDFGAHTEPTPPVFDARSYLEGCPNEVESQLHSAAPTCDASVQTTLAGPYSFLDLENSPETLDDMLYHFRYRPKSKKRRFLRHRTVAVT